MDILVVLWVVLFALQGAYRGLVAQALSLVGLAIGALAGSWIAPKLLSEGSPWVSIASLVGAIIGAALLGAASASLADALAALPRLPAGPARSGLHGRRRSRRGSWARARLADRGRRRAAAEPRLPPGRARVHDPARLMRAVPPDRVLQALARFDPFPELTLSGGRLPPPDPSVLQTPGAKAAVEQRREDPRDRVRARDPGLGLGRAPRSRSRRTRT